MRLAVLVVALLAAFAAVLAFVVTRSGGDPDFRGSEPPDGLAMPAFEIAEPDGTAVRSADLRGRAVAVTFLDSQCTDACPIVAAQMAQAIRGLGDDARRVVALAISVDPLNDTPNRIRAFLERFHALDEIRYVDAPVSQLRPVWDDFDVLPSHQTGKSNMHSAPVRVYDPNGRWRSTLHPGVDLTASNLAHDLRAALDAA